MQTSLLSSSRHLFGNQPATETAIFGGGCFWCTEAVFKALKGVQQVISGYAGGQVENPTYEAICEGSTGHAEVIKIEFDASEISFNRLLEIFFATHDPTTLNRQGNDRGTQYRSVIFYTTELQRQTALAFIDQLKQQGILAVTEVSPAPTFYPAEAYHQDFYARNPHQGYCQAIIPPKLKKLQAYFNQDLR